MGINERKSKQAQREARRRTVAANLLAGLSYRDMAAALGVSLGTVSNDAKIVIGRWQREQVDDVAEFVAVDFRRLEVALYAIWNDVQAGKLGAIDRMLKILERMATLRGYDSPTVVDLQSGGKRIDIHEVVVNVVADDEQPDHEDPVES